MRTLLLRLWNDDGGALLTTEYLFIVTILLLGVITGLVMVRDSVVVQLEELGLALGSLPFMLINPATSSGSLSCGCITTCGTVSAMDATPCNDLSEPGCF